MTPPRHFSRSSGGGQTVAVVRALGVHSRTGSAEAVAVSVTRGVPALLGRWSLDLLHGDERQIFHVVAGLPIAEAEPRVAAVVDLATAMAADRIAEITERVGPLGTVGVIVGDFPVPDSLAAIMASHTLMHAAEGALYRDALLDAATAAGARAVGVSRTVASQRLAGDLAGPVAGVGAEAGRPWRKEHKLATVAAILAAGGRKVGRCASSSPGARWTTSGVSPPISRPRSGSS
jgi:hypothetical protein